MVPGLRSLVSLPPGLLRMSLRRYVGLTLAGSLTWNAVLITVGRQLGDRWDEVGPVVAPVATVLFAIVTLAGGVAFVLWRRGRTRTA